MAEFNTVTILCLLVAAAARISTSCDYTFSFPSLNGSVYNIEENGNISLPFSLSSTCRLPEYFRINVARKELEEQRRTLCQLTHSSGSCITASKLCSCSRKFGEYKLSKTAERSDNAIWIWWHNLTSNGDTTELFFTVIGSGTDISPVPEPRDITSDEDGDHPTRLTPESVTEATDNNDDQAWSFETQVKVVVSAIAGFIALTIVVVIIVYIVTARRNRKLKVRIRRAGVSDLYNDLSVPAAPGRRAVVYSFLDLHSLGLVGRAARWIRQSVENMEFNMSTFRNRMTQQPATYPDLDPHHEDDQQVDQGHPLPAILPREPPVDEDGYMTPRVFVQQ